jgi:flagellar hook-associated protein 2
VQVGRVATTSQHTFDFATSTSAQSISIGAFTLAVDPGQDAAAVATAINARDDAPVKAIVAGGKLVLSSRASGASADFAVAATPLLTEDVARARAGVDAQYSIDGIAQPDSPSNVITASSVNTGAVLGLEMTLKAPTASPVTITVGEPGTDTDGVKAKVKAFVSAYNGAVDYMRDKLTEDPVKNPTTNSDAVQGLFKGDSMLSGVLSSMRSAIGDLSSYGISTGAPTGTATVSDDAVAGKLTIDDAKLTAALTTDPAGLRTRLEGLADRMTAAAGKGAGDRITARSSTEDATRKRLADAMAATDVRLAAKEKRLRAQFSAMESALAAAQSAQSQMTAQLSSLR